MFKNALKNYFGYLNTVRELENLSPRELSDLGITRYDIKKLARSATKTRTSSN